MQGLFEFKCRYVTPDGGREGLMPVSYYDKISSNGYWNYRYEMGRQHLTSIMIYASLLLPLRIA